MSQNFSADGGQSLQVIHVIVYNNHKEPKSSSVKVLIPATIRSAIKFS